MQTVTVSQVRRVVEQMFIIARDQGMIKQEVIDTAVVRISGRSNRSRAGRKGARAWMSINFGGSVKRPEDIHNVRSVASTWERTQAYARRQSHAETIAALEAGYYVFQEYVSFAHMAHVGNYVGNNELDCIKVLVAHEMAHVVNYCSHEPKWRGRNHDQQFLKVYRILRAAILGAAIDTRAPVAFTVPVRIAASAGEVRRPQSGVTRQVWDVCDANKGASRAEILRVLLGMGINENTAKTQYAKWSKQGR